MLCVEVVFKTGQAKLTKDITRNVILSFCHRRKLQAVTFHTYDQLSSIFWYIIHV